MTERQPDLSLEDFQNALKDLGSYIDITIEDLMQINIMAHKHAILRQTGNITVSDIMTADVVTVTPETTLKDAARLLLEKNISGLPVIDVNKKVIGIVTEADFLTAIGIPCHHPAHNLWQTLDSMFQYQTKPNALPELVGEIMTENIITISAENTVHDVIDSMKQHHVKRLLVTDEQKLLQGIITRSNLVKVLLQQLL